MTVNLLERLILIDPLAIENPTIEYSEMKDYVGSEKGRISPIMLCSAILIYGLD
jgi:hypothetical protein